MAAFKKVLIVSTTGMGDCLWGTPVIRSTERMEQPSKRDVMAVSCFSIFSLFMELKWSLKMSLSEATQNVVQHSGGTGYYVCARLYPKEHQLRICIADMGRGILGSLKSSVKHMHLTDHHEAIKLATQEGITSKVKHAGLGLHHIKKFLEVNRGQLCIISGKGKVFWKFDQGKITNQTMRHSFSGTILKLVINTGRDHGYCLASEEEPIF